MVLYLKSAEPVKLEIKRDVKGMVVVQGVKTLEVTSADELMEAFEEGQRRRHVASTNMNRLDSLLDFNADPRAHVGVCINLFLALGSLRDHISS